MKSLADYANQLHELVSALDAEIARVRADGVLEYDEAVSSKKFYDQHRAALQHLKKEVSLDVKQIRANYKGKILTTKNATSGKDQTEAVKALQLEQHQTLQPYEQVIQTIDRLLLGAAHDRQKLDALTEEFQRRHINTLPIRADTAALAVGIAAEAPETLSRDELLALLKRWRFLQKDIDQALTLPHTNPQQPVSLRGIQKGLELAITDLSDLIEENYDNQ